MNAKWAQKFYNVYERNEFVNKNAQKFVDVLSKCKGQLIIHNVKPLILVDIGELIGPMNTSIESTVVQIQPIEQHEYFVLFFDWIWLPTETEENIWLLDMVE